MRFNVGRQVNLTFSFIPILALTILLTIVFFTAEDIPTAVGRGGWVFVVVACFCCLLGFAESKLPAKSPLKISPGFAFAGAAVLATLGMLGILIEPTLHNTQAENYSKQGRYQRAISHYVRGGAANLKSKLPETYLLLGNQQLADKKYVAALATYQNVSDPQFRPNAFSEPAQKQIGLTYQAQGTAFEEEKEYARAIQSYEQAFSILKISNPTSETALNTALSRTYTAQGNELEKQKSYVEAIASYQKALTFPTDVKVSETTRQQIGAAYLAWGLNLESQGAAKASEALAKYDKVLEDAANQIAVNGAKLQARGLVFKSGSAELAANNFAKALSVYQKAVNQYSASEAQVQPYISKTYLAWGQKLLTDRNFEEALNKLEPNLTTNATSSDLPAYWSAIVDSYSGLGQKLVSEKKFDRAVTVLVPAFKTYGNYDPGNQLQVALGTAYTGYGENFETLKNYEWAIASYEEALVYVASTNGFTGNLNNALLRSYTNQGAGFEKADDYSGAVKSYEKALTYATINGNTDAKKDLNFRLLANRSAVGLQTEIRSNTAQGETFETAKNYSGAIESYQKALGFATNLGKGNFKTDLTRRLIRVHTEYAKEQVTAKNYEIAAENYDRALSYAEGIGADDAIASVSGLTIELYEQELAEAENQLEADEKAQKEAEAELKLALAEAGLVGCSLVPGVGIGCDIASAGWSLAQGDYVGVGLSVIAIVPFAGDAVGGGAKAAKVSKKVYDITQKANKVLDAVQAAKKLQVLKQEKLVKTLSRASKLKWAGKVDYSQLSRADDVIELAKDFSVAQRTKALAENKRKNGGIIRSDLTGEVLTQPGKSQRGVTPAENEWQTDHIIPKSKGGTNSYANLQIISRKENRAKSDTYP